MSKILNALKQLRSSFYRGPKNMGKMVILKIIGYQTVTLTAMHWFNYFINKQLTFTGRILILIGAMMVTYCLLDPLVLPMSYFAFGLIILYIINIISAFVFKPGVKLERNLPERAVCGSSISVQYHISSDKFLPSWDVKIDTLAYPGCYFTQTPVISGIYGKFEQHLQSNIVFKKRGVFIIPKPYAESSFPFGLCKWGNWGEGNREIRVSPKPLEINEIQLSFLSGENDVSSYEATYGTGLEFASCREFRFGDNPRHIHWPSWARSMTPIVREMCDEGRPSISILFDTAFKVNFFTKYLDVQENFENSISLLAGISLYLKNKNYSLRHIVADNEIKSFSGNNTGAIHEEVLDFCCDLEENRKIEPIEISPYILKELSTSKGLILILQIWDPNRKEVVEKLIKYGIPLKVILLGNKRPLNSEICQFVKYSDLVTGRINL